MDYVLNRASGVVHKLPASESCNTDDIKADERFSVANDEQLVTYVPKGYVYQDAMRYCLRCFPFDARSS